MPERLGEGNGEYLKRSGRKKLTSMREDQLLERFALVDRKATTRQLIGRFTEATRKTLSSRTVTRRLNEQCLHARRSRKKPLLTPEHHTQRCAWAVTHQNWTDRWLETSSFH
jgi:hypothetical protein